MRKFFSFIIGLTLFANGTAQEVVQITGRVLDGFTGKIIANANIVNLKKRKSVQTDTAGFFNQTLLRSDIIRVSAIGYETEYIVFADTQITSEKIHLIKMMPKVYDIAEVDIYAARWKDFEFEFTHTDIGNDEQQGRMEDWFHTVISEEELKMLTASASVGIPINYKSNLLKQKEKVLELERREANYELVALKFNEDFVKQTVDIYDADVSSFMEYCNFSREFILAANKYDLIVAIKKRYKSFLKTLQPGF